MKAHKVKGGAFGINLIVNKSNPLYKDQLEVCCRLGVDFIITSLGSPQQVIEQARKKRNTCFLRCGGSSLCAKS